MIEILRINPRSRILHPVGKFPFRFPEIRYVSYLRNFSFANTELNLADNWMVRDEISALRYSHRNRSSTPGRSSSAHFI